MTATEKLQVAAMLQGETRSGKGRIEDVAVTAQQVVDTAQAANSVGFLGYMVPAERIDALRKSLFALKRDDLE